LTRAVYLLLAERHRSMDSQLQTTGIEEDSTKVGLWLANSCHIQVAAEADVVGVRLGAIGGWRVK
jgi:hypothetical protein